MNNILIAGGGTVSHVRSHFALCAPAYGSAARALAGLLNGRARAELLLTAMANCGQGPESSEELYQALREKLKTGSFTHCVMNAAVCDFDGQIGEVPSGKRAPRLKSRAGAADMQLRSAPKILGALAAEFPECSFTGFKTTSGSEPPEIQALASRQMAETGAALVFANDILTRENFLFANISGCAELIFSGERSLAMDRLAAALCSPKGPQ